MNFIFRKHHCGRPPRHVMLQRHGGPHDPDHDQVGAVMVVGRGGVPGHYGHLRHLLQVEFQLTLKFCFFTTTFSTPNMSYMGQAI